VRTRTGGVLWAIGALTRPGRSARRAIAIPLVVGAIFVFIIFASSLMFSSKEEYRLLQKNIYRERARYVALAGLAKATALVFQNDFEQRWYKQDKSKYGFTGSFSGEVGGGKFVVRAEDVVNEMTSDMVGGDAVSRENRVTKLTYNRIDLFARGTYGDQSVIVYQAVVLKPEEKVYAYQAVPVTYSNGATGTAYTNIQQR